MLSITNFNNKFYLSAAIVLFLSVHCSYALKCYHCESERACDTPSLIECNKFLGVVANEYFSQFYNIGKPVITSATSFECITHNLTTDSQRSYFKTCAFAEMKLCSLPLLGPPKDNYTNVCYNCTWDNCNSSNTFHINKLALLFSPIFILIMKYCKQ